MRWGHAVSQLLMLMLMLSKQVGQRVQSWQWHWGESEETSSLIWICTWVVPAASGGGADPPRAFELAEDPAADLAAAQRVRCQVTDVEAGKLTQEISVGHPASIGVKAGRRRRKSELFLLNRNMFTTTSDWPQIRPLNHQRTRSDLSNKRRVSTCFYMFRGSTEQSKSTATTTAEKSCIQGLKHDEERTAHWFLDPTGFMLNSLCCSL